MDRSGAELGARVVGFEAYLSSPEEEWTRDDGGVLQMFASGMSMYACSLCACGKWSSHLSLEVDGIPLTTFAALLLRSAGSGGKPLDKASAEIAPLWNTMLLYKVGQQNPSCSAVEEILSDKTRMCISGYYHSEQEVAEVQQAAANKNGGTEFQVLFDTKPFEGFPEDPPIELPEKVRQCECVCRKCFKVQHCDFICDVAGLEIPFEIHQSGVSES